MDEIEQMVYAIKHEVDLIKVNIETIQKKIEDQRRDNDFEHLFDSQNESHYQLPGDLLVSDPYSLPSIRDLHHMPASEAIQMPGGDNLQVIPSVGSVQFGDSYPESVVIEPSQ